jgi:hypothetical protein
MNKNIKKYAALSLIWAQVAFVGAGLSDDSNNEATHNNVDQNATQFPIQTPANDITPDNVVLFDLDKILFNISQENNNEVKPTVIKTRGGESVSSLLNEFESATTIEGACLANSIQHLIDGLSKEAKISKSDAAIRIIDTLSQKQIRELPALAKSELIAAIDDTTEMTPDKYFALRKVYTNTSEDPSFQVWDAEKQVELAQKLSEHPALVDAKKNWHNMNDQEKLQALRVAVDITIETYGSDIGAVSVPLNYIDHPNPNVYGLYLPGMRAMFLNINADAIPENFQESMTVTVHEALHAYHHQLEDRVRDGTLDEDHPAYGYAHILKESGTRYIFNGFDFIAYTSNPTEKHAWEIEYIGKYIGNGPGTDVVDAKRALKEAKEDYEAFKQKREDAKENAKNLVCTPTQMTLY